jgi:hypothetical protein
MSSKNEKAAEPPRKRVVREITALHFKQRVGTPGQFDTDLAWVSAQDVAIQPSVHEVYGPGVWLRWKNQKGRAKFVPVSNIASIDYAEREES